MILKIHNVILPNGDSVRFTYKTLEEKTQALYNLGVVYDPTTDDLDNEINIENLRSGYIVFVARMQQIQTATNPTNAQVIQAVKDLARYLEITGKILRFLFEE